MVASRRTSKLIEDGPGGGGEEPKRRCGSECALAAPGCDNLNHAAGAGAQAPPDLSLNLHLPPSKRETCAPTISKYLLRPATPLFNQHGISTFAHPSSLPYSSTSMLLAPPPPHMPVHGTGFAAWVLPIRASRPSLSPVTGLQPP
ncbi:hypothetical protein LIA77_01579 [Sarocladium implicatum]|nr:hypothetical protein LIA77_01579 [Sarocladium implicatum]